MQDEAGGGFSDYPTVIRIDERCPGEPDGGRALLLNPIGVEFLGRPFAEPVLIKLAYAYE